MKIGELQRRCLPSHVRTTSFFFNDTATTESIFLRASSLAVSEYPVCGGSTNTRSKCSNHDCGLSVTVYGGEGIVPSSLMMTLFGPSAPRWSHTDAEPGPPLKANKTGRVRGSA